MLSLLIYIFAFLLIFFIYKNLSRNKKDETHKDLFRRIREDAFLIHLRLLFPNKTFKLDGAIATADPKLFRKVLLSRAHSIGRSIVYRLIANIMPFSDGILFSANEAWKKRHSLLTQLFSSSHVSKFAVDVFSSSVTTAELVLAFINSQNSQNRLEQEQNLIKNNNRTTPSTTSLILSDTELLGSSLLNDSYSLSPLGLGTGITNEAERTMNDLLTFIRWISMKTLFAWGFGNRNIDNDGGSSALYIARLFDAYSRTCFEIMPQKERLTFPYFFSWIREYISLRSIAYKLKEAIKFQISFLDSIHTSSTSLNSSVSSLIPESVLHRLVTSKSFSEQEIVSEMNHIHGAHKAVAFLTTCALVELTVNEEARKECITELESICGRPSNLLSAKELIELASSSSSLSSSSQFLRPITRTDIETGRLPKTMNIMKETLRKHVVSMGVMRKLGKDEDALIYIPDSNVSLHHNNDTENDSSKAMSAGDEILLLLHALHHDEKLWGEDAHVWEPDRWNSQSDYWKRRKGKKELTTINNKGENNNNNNNNNNNSVSDSDSFIENDGFPASSPDAYFPFLDGSRRCAGMLLAQLEFVGMLYALLVVFDVRAKLPLDLISANVRAKELLSEKPSQQELLNESVGIGGGVSIGKGRVLERPKKGSCIALIADQFAIKTRNVRIHLVKRPDYFTALDGNVEFEIGRRQ
jgi:hypothetical protein